MEGLATASMSMGKSLLPKPLVCCGVSGDGSCEAAALFCVCCRLLEGPAVGSFSGRLPLPLMEPAVLGTATGSRGAVAAVGSVPTDAGKAWKSLAFCPIIRIGSCCG